MESIGVIFAKLGLGRGIQGTVCLKAHEGSYVVNHETQSVATGW
jgi:hypothetical protein